MNEQRGLIALIERSIRETSVSHGCGSFASTQGLIHRVTQKKFARYRQEIAVGVPQALEETLNGLGKKLLKKIRKDCLVRQSEFPLSEVFGIFPEGTKFFFSAGKTKVFIIEQKPQKHRIRFDQGLIQLDPRAADRDIGWRTIVELAFPYVIFVVEFKEKNFCDLWVFYRNSPLTSLDDKLCVPNLPNIHRHYPIACLTEMRLKAKSLAGKAEEIITGFWRSVFTNHIAEGYFEMSLRDKAHFGSIWQWERSSREDMSFVTKVKWIRSRWTIRSVIKDICGERGIFDTQRRTFEHIVSEVVQGKIKEITKVAERFCAELKTETWSKKATLAEFAAYLDQMKQEIARTGLKRFRQELPKLLKGKGE